MKFKEFTQSKYFARVIYIIGGLLVALLIFQAGIFVGYRIAAFSISWDNTRGGNIRDPRSIFAPFGMDADDMNPHGAVGEIISVRLPNVMVKGLSGNEQIILLGTTTSIRNLRNAATSSDLTVGQNIITVGTPDDKGVIHATFIRIMPQVLSPLPTSTTPTSTAPRQRSMMQNVGGPGPQNIIRP